MTTSTSTDAFLDLVRKSGAVDPRRLDNFLSRQAAPPDDPKDLAELLIQNGLMTRYQADPLLKGKLQRFLLSSKYRVLDRLGAGGMASVFLCEHKVMRRRVAIKVLPPNLANNSAAVDRFHREARAAAALHHPNIVGAHDVDVDGNFHFLVTEYVEGRNLHEMVRLNGVLSPERAAHYISQAALGLQHAHEKGMVHRDIKPANLLLDRTGTVKILDMGLALLFHEEDDGLTKEHDAKSILGTAEFLAPEQAMDSHAVDIRADIYSLGMTLYFLLTGKTPFSEGGTTAQKIIWHQIRPPKPVTEYRPDVPEELSAVIDTMLAKAPADRQQTPVEVAVALQPWTAQPIPPPADSEMPKPLIPLPADGGGYDGGSASSVSSSSSFTSLPAINLPSALDASSPSAAGATTAPVPRAAPVSGGARARLTPPPTSARPVVAAPAPVTKGPASHTVSDPARSAVKARAVVADDPGSQSGVRRKKKAQPEKSAKAKIAALGIGGGLLALLVVGLILALSGGDDKPAAPATDPVPPLAAATTPAAEPTRPKNNNPKGPKKGGPKTEPTEPTKDPTPPTKSPTPPTKRPTPPPKRPAPPAGPTITAEYFPLTERDVEYDVYDAVAQQGRQGWAYNRQRFSYKPSGEVQITVVAQGTSLVPETTQEPVAQPVTNARPMTQMVRTTDGKIEVGTLTNPRSKEYAYEPILKLGTKLGDTWEYSLPNGNVTQCEVVAFGTWDANVPSVTVRCRQPAPGVQGAEMVTTHVYAKGTGEVERAMTLVAPGKNGTEQSLPKLYVKIHDGQ